MNELEVVSTKEILGRSFTVYGTVEEPLFLAKDVAEMIEHSDVSMMMKSIDSDEKVKFVCDTNNACITSKARKTQESWFLTENGLYEVIFQSRKPIAKEFKAKVKELLHDLRVERKKIVDLAELVGMKMPIVTQKSERELNVEEAHILENLIPLCPIETYKQILASHITKKVTGEFLLPLPQRKEEYYRATEIGKELGISKKQVGQIAEKHGLKTEEFGEMIWDRAANGKQVPGFVYNSKGREKIKELYYADKNNNVS